MADTPPVIIADTRNLRLRQSMLLGSHLEGGWNSPYPVGDNGTSFGPFQMHIGGALTAAGGTPKQAENPKWAVPAMMPAYRNAVNQISDKLWTTNPQRAAEQAAVIAERPAQDYYSSRGTGTVNSAWSDVQAELKGRKSTGGMPPQSATLTSSGDAGGILGNAFLKALESILPGGGANLGSLGTAISAASGGLKTDAERVGLVVFGAILIIVGLLILAAPAAERGAAIAARTSRQGRALGLGGSSGPDPAEQARKQAIASKSLELGEKKLALAQQRENRLAGKQDFGG